MDWTRSVRADVEAGRDFAHWYPELRAGYFVVDGYLDCVMMSTWFCSEAPPGSQYSLWTPQAPA